MKVKSAFKKYILPENVWDKLTLASLASLASLVVLISPGLEVLDLAPIGESRGKERLPPFRNG